MAQQARTVETLGLAQRDSDGDETDIFINKVSNVDAILRELQGNGRSGVDTAVLTQAIDARDQWVAAHDRMALRLGVGDFTGAANIAVGSGAEDSAAEYRALDDALWEAITDSRESLRADISHASRVLSASAPGVTMLAVLGVVGIAAGFWPRLREYQ